MRKKAKVQDKLERLSVADARHAMDVFHHPYAYAAREGLELGASREAVYA